MVSPAMLIVALVIAIAIILFCIIVLKLNASIGMVLASLFMGVAGGLDLKGFARSTRRFITFFI